MLFVSKAFGIAKGRLSLCVQRAGTARQRSEAPYLARLPSLFFFSSPRLCLPKVFLQFARLRLPDLSSHLAMALAFVGSPLAAGAHAAPRAAAAAAPAAASAPSGGSNAAYAGAALCMGAYLSRGA